MKRSRKNGRKLILAVLMCALLMLTLAGCGEEYTVSINDMGEKTEMTITSGKKVSAILEEAGITVGEQDEVEPALTERIKEPSEIVIKRYAAVTVVDAEGTEHAVTLVGGTVAEALTEAGITLGEGQIVSETDDTYLTDGMTITVTQQPGVTLTADGSTDQYYTAAETVGAFLEEQSITLGENDRLTPEADAAIEDGMEIVLQRVEIKEETETETIAHSSETQNSDSLESGKTKVKQEGQDGEKEITYTVTYVDGEEESREVASENVTKEPVTEIILKGTKKASSSSSSSKSSSSKSSSGSSSSGSSSSSSSSGSSSSGPTVVSVQNVEDCDGSGHGVKITTYSDGTTKEEEY